MNDVNKVKYEMSINTLAMCANDEEIWMAHGTLPLLMKYDFKIDKITMARVIPCSFEGKVPRALFKAIYQKGSDIFLIPNNARELIINSIGNDQFTSIPIENPRQNMFCGCSEKENKLYFVPYKYHKMVSFDLETHEVEYLAEWKKYNQEQLCINDFCEYNQKLICVIWNMNFLMEYDFDRKKWNKIDINTKEDGFSQICKTRDELCLYNPNQGHLLLLSPEKYYIKKTSKLDMGDACLFECINNNVIVDSINENTWMIIDDEINLRKYTNTAEKISTVSKPQWKFGTWINYHNKYEIGIDTENHLIKIFNDKIIVKELILESDVLEQIKKSNDIYHLINYENEICLLPGFIDEIIK